MTPAAEEPLRSLVAVAAVLGAGLAACDEPRAVPSDAATTATAAVTRVTITIDAEHDLAARKDATPYAISPSTELAIEVGAYKFTARDAGAQAPDAVHVARGSSGYHRGSFSGSRVILGAASLDPIKGGVFAGFEAGESYTVAIGVEGTSTIDGAMRFTPLWMATVKVAR